MISRVLVDSSFLIAQLDERDVHHKAAKSIHELFSEQGVSYLYLDCMVNETITVLARRARERKVDPAPIIRRVRQEFSSERLTWTGPELPRLWAQALDILEEYRGQLSLHDCLIVLIAREEAVPWVASFDRGFDQVEGLRRIGTAEAFRALR